MSLKGNLTNIRGSMDQYSEAKKLFNDELNTHECFESLTFEFAKKDLLNAINSHETPLIFLLGDPGSGKSFLLNYIDKNISFVEVAKFFSHPYFDERELLEILLETTGIEVVKNKYSKERLIEYLNNHYKDLKHTVFIDEAQLLDERQLELIRILSDMQIFQFVLAMHKKEGENVLQKAHFKSRTKKIVYINPLENHEVANYIRQRLLSKNLSELATAFEDKYVTYIAKISLNNFRTIKKVTKTLFEIILHANERGHKKYSKINKATLTMAAIDTGLIDVK